MNCFNNHFCVLYRHKHGRHNKQVNSLIILLKHLGCEVKGFQHQSAGSEREIIQLIATIIQDQIVYQVKSCPPYGILMDNMTVVTSKGQMILFIQYYSRKEEKVKTKFLSVESVLDQSDSCSANAETLFQVFSKKLNELVLEAWRLMVLQLC